MVFCQCVYFIAPSLLPFEVARKREIDAEIVAVGHRLAAIRKSLSISQTAFALKLEIGRERLASYESGRVPMPYSIGEHAVIVFQISPLWLATGQGQKRIGNPHKYIRIGDYAGHSFYQVIKDQLADGVQLNPSTVEPMSSGAQPQRDPHGPFLSISQSVALQAFTADFLPDIFGDVPNANIDRFVSDLQMAAKAISERYRYSKKH